MKSAEKLNFSKFFPSTQSFVVVTGKAKAPDDFFLQIDIGDGIEKTSFNISEYNSKQSMEMLRAMNKAIQESLEFFERTMKLPAIPSAVGTVTQWDDFFKVAKPVAEDKKPAAKKPAAKKKASTKK